MINKIEKFLLYSIRIFPNIVKEIEEIRERECYLNTSKNEYGEEIKIAKEQLDSLGYDYMLLNYKFEQAKIDLADYEELKSKCENLEMLNDTLRKDNVRLSKELYDV